MQQVTLADVRAAAKRISTVAARTPVMSSHSFSQMTGRQLFLKAENLQRGGSFKIRGALNAISLLSPEASAEGVVAASAGNHAQGVALAASALDISSTVFMPVGAAIPKVLATREYGADVRLVGDHMGQSLDAALAFAAETGASMIHPYDDPAIIAGQGTLGLEMLEQLPELGSVVIPVGGGGLIAGIALAIKELRPSVVVAGVEAAAMPLYIQGRAAGRPVEIDSRPTVADGISTPRPSALAFSIIERWVDELVAVEEADITQAVTLILERAKLLVEPSGAVGLAAMLASILPGLPEPVMLLLSGGNIDLVLLDTVVRKGLEARGRFGTLRVRVPDIPGQLAKVVSAVGDHGGNIIAVEHHREGTFLPFGTVEIWMAIATRSRQHFEEIVAALGEYEVIL